MRTNCKSRRIILTLTILSVAVTFGSCAACISVKKGGDPRTDYYRASDGNIREVTSVGVGSDAERTYGVIMLSAFLTSFIGSIATLAACAERAEKNPKP